MKGDQDNRQSLIAAAIFLAVAGAALYFMPQVVLWIGGYSPALAVLAGSAVIAAFFLFFWVRSRFQKR